MMAEREDNAANQIMRRTIFNDLIANCGATTTVERFKQRR